ncbi:MAG: ADP-ribosylglycohydrolase family protein [Verrucomicrobia bacterium]|nr:ADP-ribosylglycohydrolase family protein [Leptolyngbya sp. ES-bin-22]
MRYSLSSRFQGTLLTAALGAELGTYGCLEHPHTKEGTCDLEPEGSSSTPASLAGWHPGLMSSLKASTPIPWGEAAVQCARVLVHAGRWNEFEMAAIGVRLTAGRLTTGAILAQSRSREASSTAEYALAALPLALFFYEDEAKQRQLLLQTAKLWQAPPGAEAGLLAVGYAIAQVLKDRLERLMLVPQTIAYLKQSTANPTDILLDLIETLEQAQALLGQGAGLYAAIEQLRAKAAYSGNEAMALAFYCFLSTPDELHLSLLRAARFREAASVVCALTGALSGAHNSLNGLPLAWRIDSPLPLLWDLSNVELKQLAAQLFAVWSGLYDPATPLPTSAIEAAGVIRPR